MVVRVMTHDDIDFAVSMTHLEGWLYHSEEFDRMLRFDPEGSFVFEDKAPVAFITSITYGRTGVVGHLIVTQKARGKRIGETLVKKAIEYMEGKGADSIVLFATKEGFGLYEKLGFRPLKEALCIQARPARLAPAAECRGLSRVGPEDLDPICEIDSDLFGDDRSRLIRDLYREFPESNYKILRDGEILGYAFGRTTTAANDLGPWSCVTGRTEDAQALYDSVASHFSPDDVYMGLFSGSPKALEVAGSLNKVRVWSTTLMARGEERYAGQSDVLLGPAAFELG